MNCIKIGLDLGNNTICAVTSIDGEYMYEYIPSTYQQVTDFSSKNIVSVKGTKIELGHKNGHELTNIDKTNRLYIEHQILWAINSLFKNKSKKNFELELAVGLPISDFIDKDKRNKYQECLNNIKEIKGSVDDRDLSIEIKRVLILAEGHSAIKSLIKEIPKNGYSTVIHDIGFLTTDVIVVDIEDNGDILVRKPISIGKGISYLYEAIYEEAFKLECISSKSELDYYIRKGYSTIRAKNNKNYMLDEALMKRRDECKSIMNDISNHLGFKTSSCNKIFVGGGSVLLLKILGEDWISNHISINDNTRYSANAKGYYLSL